MDHTGKPLIPGPAATTKKIIRIGVSGHLDLHGATARRVTAGIREELLDIRESAMGHSTDLVGVSCLAMGADTMFAKEIIDLGGRLEVVLPSLDYAQTQVRPENAADFDELLARAADVRTMPVPHAGEQAYVAANDAMLSVIDLLIAVWDGEPAPSPGGTASVVRTARERGIPVRVVWPEGARRGRPDAVNGGAAPSPQSARRPGRSPHPLPSAGPAAPE